MDTWSQPKIFFLRRLQTNHQEKLKSKAGFSWSQVQFGEFSCKEFLLVVFVHLLHFPVHIYKIMQETKAYIPYVINYNYYLKAGRYSGGPPKKCLMRFSSDLARKIEWPRLADILYCLSFLQISLLPCPTVWMDIYFMLSSDFSTNWL